MRTLTQIISVVLQPLFIPLYGMLLLFYLPMYRMFYTFNQKMFIFGGVALFTAIIPLLIILQLIKLKKVKDFFIADKNERTLPYVVCFFCYLLCAVFLWWINIDFWVVNVMFGATLSLVLLMAVNFFWKISAHMSGIGGLCGAIFAGSILMFANPVSLFAVILLLSGVLASSRIYLKAHTLGQTCGGFFLGFCCTFIFALL